MGDRNVDYTVLEEILARIKGPGRIPLEILTCITDNFSEDKRIGRGGFSDVYKGVLHDCTVAVKKIRVDFHTLDDKLFIREVESLLKIIEHPNVVRFLGFFADTHREVEENAGAEKKRLVEIKERLLCFEYISSGSLEKYITDELRGLEWNIRYQIIKGVCEGLQYLHNEVGIIHMDLKPANIMIDMDDMVPKITDFGVAKLVENNYTTGVRFVSRGYCAPEYMKIGKPTFECDIYSLGIIIIEIITGRNDEMPIKDHVIRRWRHRWRKSATYTPLHVQQITKCFEIAERCTHQDPTRRPSIWHIIRDLNKSASTDVYISAAKQIPSWDFDAMLDIEPLELRFAFELNKEISNEVVLTNETGNCIAFNIKTSSQLHYCTEPNKGIVRPRSNSVVNITLQVQGTTTLGCMPCGDEFIVQSTNVADCLTDDEITEDIFNEEAGTVVDVVNLTVAYEKLQADKAIEANASVSKEATACSSSKDVRLNFHPIETTSATSQYKASERAAVDIMTGAMGGLLPKLGKLLKGEHNLPEDLEEEVEFLEEQVTDMYTALCNVAHEEMHMLDLQDKKWANKIKNLSYDLEDMVDGFLISFKGSEPITNLDGFQSLVQKMLKRVRNVADRNKEVKLAASMANRPVRSTDVDPRMLDWYKDHKYLVGIDGPRDRLVEKLTGGDDHASKQKLKIISIFGEGGLGKTTLAKNVFDKLASKFFLKAFVPVGRNPDIKRVLEDILFELDKNGNKDIHNSKKDERQLIDGLRNLLGNKRYFIVIDDIWDIESWEIIKCALIDNDNGSRVMTTSRNYAVAKSSGEACKLEPLSYDQSKQLFYSRLTRKGTCTFDQGAEKCTEYILQKCGGLPLAIITIASLLDGKRVEDWPKLYNSIKFGHEDNRVENTKKILLYSYFDLPYHLKTCLLYLSIYPEDKEIEKNTLVWKWIAEGFVRQEKGKTLFEVGEGYFNQLINRSLIQLVELGTPQKIHDCRVQDMALDLIRSMVPEENFVTTLDNGEQDFTSQSTARILAVHRGIFQRVEKYYEIPTGTIFGCRLHDMVHELICSMAKESFVNILDTDEQHLSCQNNARILAVHKRALEQHDLANTCRQVVVRSFIVSRSVNISCVLLDSLLPRFRVLRVLCLEGVQLDFPCPLENIAELRHLRYLGLAGTYIRMLPMGIYNLRCLQILDLMGTNMEALPESVTLLRELKCLRCCTYGHNQLVKWRGGMGSLTSLEELRLDLEISSRISDVYDDRRYVADFVEELGKLTELRVLEININGFTGSMYKALVESLNKLKRMEELEIIDDQTPTKKWDDYSPSQLLRNLILNCYKMPVWIDVASLGNITFLNLEVSFFTPRDLVQLGSLPELRSLILKYICKLDSLDGIVDAAVGDAFPKLHYLKTNCTLLLRGEMRCLEWLELSVNAVHEVLFDIYGILFLHSLVKVRAGIIYPGLTRATKRVTVEGEMIRRALRFAVDNHPNHPILEIWEI